MSPLTPVLQATRVSTAPLSDVRGAHGAAGSICPSLYLYLAGAGQIHAALTLGQRTRGNTRLAGLADPAGRKTTHQRFLTFHLMGVRPDVPDSR